MTITRFMTELPSYSATAEKDVTITAFSHPLELPPLFDSQGMSRDSIRRHIRQERNSLTEQEQHQLSLIASRHLLAEIQRVNAKHVALYLTHDGELGTKELINALWKLGINTYLPVIHPFSQGHLLFLHYHRHSEMVSNQYGILEPKLNVTEVMPVAQLDMIVTPLVAFDDKGNRMGMGGGYYDRTLSQVGSAEVVSNEVANKKPLASVSKKPLTSESMKPLASLRKKPLAVGFAHDCQQVSTLPIEYWDIPLPVVITPTRRLAQG